ncbi:META domain-containing protein [Novipirellula artificiosorum]|uniref:META domain protein n=1 Tax=Novipirellula artificiosorum TaxID=2528016 RepID=A0A5C6E5G1_9BACT|nr:META domain-containing protein [Novipirellula artificiosorum]TWU42666.1 META domain protein [Novipirellula artificiosorum]
MCHSLSSCRLMMALSVFVLGTAPTAFAQDPLHSWNEGSAKAAILDFVDKTTAEDSDDFVAVEDRIAVFDNDGTLWPENPLPFQLIFAIDELKRLAPKHPEWKQDKLLAAALSGDVATLKEDVMGSLKQLLIATHSGITTDQFNQRVEDWMATAKHPRFDRHYTDLVYQPMLEVLVYLRANGYRTFIVSGGGADFMRVWADQTYGIPSEQTIGSIGEVKFEIRDGVPVLIKQAAISFIDDKEGKPVAIHRQVGRRPVVAFGNSDGDKAMLEWTTMARSPSLGVIVHHTDAEREYAYDKSPQSSGKLIEALADAPKRGWVVVDMAKDWNQVFPDENAPSAGAAARMDLAGTNWLVEDIAGRGVIDRAQTTIEFSEDGTVSGNTAVNRYSGKVSIKGDSIDFGPLITTRRAGPPAVMDQEQKFLAAMERVKRVRVDENGLLHFGGEDGEAVIRASKIQ